MADKHGSNRYGWNQRGGTNRYYLQLAKDQSEMLQYPDSRHWERKALEMRDWLVKKMGGDDFKIWADRLFPDDTIDQATWKQVYELYKAKFENLIGGGISHDWEDDPKHYKTRGY